MVVKGIIDEDFTNYKKISMFIAFPNCSFKCEKESGLCCCQNSALATSPDIEISTQAVVDRYMKNPITSAMVCGGLEPFDSWDELYDLVKTFRKATEDDIVIYTGYKEFESEAFDKLVERLRLYRNIIVKFGRFIPDKPHKYDDVLGVELSSNNQYAKMISYKRR